MKWTIVGTGWISESFAQALVNNQQEIVGIVSRNESSGQKFANKWNIANVFTNLNQDTLSEVVYVATPNKIHFEVANLALDLNKHVMIEKPLSHELKLTKQLFAKAHQKNLKIMEAYAHITQDFFLQNIECEKKLNVNYMQLSSKIKDNSYQSASSFSKELFGGVVADLGVYALSAAVVINGTVKNIEIHDSEFLNDVVSTLTIKLIHNNNKISEITISKTMDGDNALYIDGIKKLSHLNFANIKNKMDKEVEIFLTSDEKILKHFEKISIEVAKLVENIHQLVYKENINE